MAIPKYEQIKSDLLAEIKEHKFVPGSKFYSESDLKSRYNVSSITVVRALNELTNAGYLYRIRGKGTFVSRSKIATRVNFSDIENHSLDSETVKVLSVKKKNSPEVNKILGIAANESYYEIVRVRYTDETPFILHYSHLPTWLVKEPISQNLTDYNSIYDKVHRDFGIDLSAMASVETNEIFFPDDAKILNLLSLSFREPVLKQVKQTYLADNRVAEYIISYKHWRYFKTKIEVLAE